MNPLSFEEAVERICVEDNRYAPEAYRFVREALDTAIRLYEKPRSGRERHVTGHELLEGIRRHALSEYGPMAFRVLTTWGLHRTDDFGEIVFNLVARGVLGRTDKDRREDFSGGYDFFHAFKTPFQPANGAASCRRDIAAAECISEGETEP